MIRTLSTRLRRSPARWAFLFVAAWQVWILSVLLSSGSALWAEVGPALMYSLIIMGPVAAAFAGLRAWLERRPALADLDRSMVRDPMVRRWTAAAGEIGWVLAAYVVGVVYLFAVVAPGATWGGPNWLLIVAGAMGLIASGYLGWAVAWLLPSRVTGPLVGLALWFLMGVLGSIDIDLNAPWIPTAFAHFSPFQTLRSGLLVSQFSIYGGLVLVGVALSAVAARTRRIFLAVAIGSLLVVVGVVTSPAGRRAGVAMADPAEVCDNEQITICIHPAYGGVSPELADTVRTIMEPLVAAGVAPPRVVQAEFGRLEPGSVTFQMSGSLHEVAESVVLSAMAGDSDLRCLNNASNDEAQGHEAVWTVVETWLVSRATGDDGGSFTEADGSQTYQRFATVPYQEKVDWLAANIDRLRSCQLTVDDLP